MTAPVPIATAVALLATIVGGSFIDTVPAPVDTPYLSAAVGYFDAFQDHRIKSRQDSSTDLRVELNPNWAIYKRGIVTVSPFVSGEATTAGSFAGFAGLAADFQYHHVFLTPSFAPGLYSSGDGKNMGSPIEFRSQVEAGYEFDNQSRLGVAVSHISNADISDTNPGAEIVSIYYHHPIGF